MGLIGMGDLGAPWYAYTAVGTAVWDIQKHGRSKAEGKRRARAAAQTAASWQVRDRQQAEIQASARSRALERSRQREVKLQEAAVVEAVGQVRSNARVLDANYAQAHAVEQGHMELLAAAKARVDSSAKIRAQADELLDQVNTADQSNRAAYMKMLTDALHQAKTAAYAVRRLNK